MVEGRRNSTVVVNPARTTEPSRVYGRVFLLLFPRAFTSPREKETRRAYTLIIKTVSPGGNGRVYIYGIKVRRKPDIDKFTTHFGDKVIYRYM